MMNNYNAKNVFRETQIEQGFIILKCHNQSDDICQIDKQVNRNYIQMHFCIKNSAKLGFNSGAYTIQVTENNSLLLYNPNQDLPINLELLPKAISMVILISIEKFHTFFTQEAGLIHFLNEENRDKKYYFDKILDPNEIVVLNQMFHYGLHSSLEKLYTKGKVFELLSLYFNKSNDENVQKCPFLEDEVNVEKIRKAKVIVIEHMIDPPSLKDLSDQVKLPIQHLKDGFKQIYGETVFTFLFNYKMAYARKLLATKKYNISEISFEVGYSTPSHFIVAFKKKYGSTPKKYLSNL